MKAIGIRLTVPESVDRVRSWLETEYQAYIYEKRDRVVIGTHIVKVEVPVNLSAMSSANSRKVAPVVRWLAVSDWRTIGQNLAFRLGHSR
jgi:hypothetical protein